MRQGEYQYSIDVACPPDRAVALFADLPRLVSVHPLVVGTRELDPVADAARSYAITDRLAVGPLRFRITYRADVLEVGERLVVTRARQRPATTLVSRVRVGWVGEGGEGDEGSESGEGGESSELGGGRTRVDVTVTVTTLSLLFGYTLRTAKAAHLRMAEGAKRLLETESSAA